MYSEEGIRRAEDVLQQQAALLIQHQWRHYQQQREAELEVRRVSHPSQNQLQAHFTSTENDSGLRRGSTFSQNGDGISPHHTGAATQGNHTPEEQRALLVDEYRTLLNERRGLLEQNRQLQHILARHFAEQRARKGESEPVAAASPKAEQQYWGLVHRLTEERAKVERTRRSLAAELERQRADYQATVDEALELEREFRECICNVARRATFMRSSHTIAPAELQAFMSTEETQREKIREARVRHIQLHNTAKKLRRTAGDKNNRSDGMFLIDFEQLKIENANLNEKIEERNEDVVKLRRKVTTTIHVLTHVKEKLEFMKGENSELRGQVAATEGELNEIRDTLAQTKRRRDGFAKANTRMREKMPLVGSEDLLLDYEQRKGAIHSTRARVVELTEQHKKLLHYVKTQQPVIDGLRRAISHYPT